MLKKIKRLVKTALGRDLFVRPEIDLPTEFHGTEYGGWAILRDSLASSSIVYSFGVGEDITFDEALIEKYGCVVLAFDPTPKSLRWVAEQKLDPRFKIEPFGLHDKDDVLEFFEPEQDKHVSFSAHTPGRGKSLRCEVRRLSTLLKERGHNRVDLLKMDIEGSEYGVIESILADGIEVDQLLIEFHHRMIPDGVQKTKRALSMLAGGGYRLYAVSSRGEEFSFVHGRALARLRP